MTRETVYKCDECGEVIDSFLAAEVHSPGGEVSTGGDFCTWDCLHRYIFKKCFGEAKHLQQDLELIIEKETDAPPHRAEDAAKYIIKHLRGER